MLMIVGVSVAILWSAGMGFFYSLCKIPHPPVPPAIKRKRPLPLVRYRSMVIRPSAVKLGLSEPRATERDSLLHAKK